MSKIITPTDSIIITIDNRTQPAQCAMKLSRDMPAPYVVMILAQLITQTMADQMVRLSTAATAPANPEPQPKTTD